MPWPRSRLKPIGQLVVVGGEHAAVAGAAEVLGRIEAEAADVADRAGAAAVELGADRLGGVFDDRQPGARRRFEQIGSISAHWPNRWTGSMALVAGVISPLDGRRIDVERVRIDVGEDRPGAQPGDGAGGGEEGEAGQDHLVARPDVQGHQRQQQGVAARGTADGVPRLAVVGHALFELLDVRPEHEGPALPETRARAAAISSFSAACCRPRSSRGTPRSKVSVPFLLFGEVMFWQSASRSSPLKGHQANGPGRNRATR